MLVIYRADSKNLLFSAFRNSRPLSGRDLAQTHTPPTLTARGLKTFSRDEPSIAQTAVLPGLWPPKRTTSMAEALMPPMPHPGSEWYEQIRQRDERRRAEYQRVQDQLEAEAKAKEEAENAAVRKRIDEDAAARRVAH